MNLHRATDLALRAQQEADAIEDLPPGEARDRRLGALTLWLDQKWTRIPETIRTEALGCLNQGQRGQ